MSNWLKALWATYLRGLIILHGRAVRNILSLFLSPALYAVAFGWGLGQGLEVEGFSYLAFMLPGLIALSGMNQSFSISTEINTARFLTHYFEEYLISPAPNCMVVLGTVLYGFTKGMLSLIAVLLIAGIFGVFPSGGALLVLPAAINSFMFAAMGVWIALLARSHRDMTTINSFVMVPMSFIAGTFFSVDRFPAFFAQLARFLPLTHSSMAIRSVFLSGIVPWFNILVMVFFSILFFALAVMRVRKAVLQ